MGLYADQSAVCVKTLHGQGKCWQTSFALGISSKKTLTTFKVKKQKSIQIHLNQHLKTHPLLNINVNFVFHHLQASRKPQTFVALHGDFFSIYGTLDLRLDNVDITRIKNRQNRHLARRF
ncbi:hypothetical protein AKJ31_12500 [Vibrio hepatarius]|jgi:hypothetical protein|uniref:Uncharacterized protein n=1 Tax=Vibrio hepatarius TaxID=171383 RepID=A0A0M0HZ24_9VIBR|nr:hypothetical protein AKJ31_12500 [Vibrio hepatarius]